MGLTLALTFMVFPCVLAGLVPQWFPGPFLLSAYL